MSTPSDQDVIDRVTRQSQIIVGALITGVVFFLGIATVIDMPSNAAARPGAGVKSAEGPGQRADVRLNARPASDGTDFRVLLTWIAVAFAVMSLPMSFVVPGLIAQQNRRAIAAGTWPPASQSAATDRLLGPKESRTSTGQLALVYQTQLIIASALNEGPAFLRGCRVPHREGYDRAGRGCPADRRARLEVSDEGSHRTLDRRSARETDPRETNRGLTR